MALFPISADKVQLSSVAPVVTDCFTRSVLKDAGGTVARAALTGGAQFSDGLLLTALGQVVYVDATVSLPANAQYCNGIPLASTGEVCISTGSMASYSNGLPMAANGAVCAAVV